VLMHGSVQINRHNTLVQKSKLTSLSEKYATFATTGKYAADVLLFYWWNTHLMTGFAIPELPMAISYDTLMQRLIMDRLTVKTVNLSFADGMSYA